ncbi:MAG: polyprenyl synthetase family protein [Thaumarchaeota archaeon]|nr:polyprenyl synthetase family protein [Nitrososphaerota archaeon]MDE1817862.1 polyprenyl synthetase family protein [Nitrososphaerota archaeon]MDE1875794.1 polyprenyl synthetase family protein [Nitrososphaerota archaeon]
MDRKNFEINPLIKDFENYINKVDNAIKQELDLYSASEFFEPLQYSLEGGKRIRPLILILSAESVGKCDGNAYSASCAVELLHTESVIHDDIIDNEILRRRKDPFHIKYGYNTSIITGDFVLGLILNISSRLDNARIGRELAITAMMMSEGEMIETRLETSEDVTFDDYVKVMEYKTATAFEAAAKIGAILGGGTEEQILALAEYGKNMGIAYQIRDDLQDWNNEDKLFNTLIKKSSDPRIVFDRMDVMLNNYSKKAKTALRKINDGPSRARLESLLDFTMLSV